LPQPAAPPPPTPVKQPFQNLGDEDHSDIPKRKLLTPNSSVESAVKALTQHSDNGHLVVSDLGNPGAAGTGTAPHAEVELQSDPQGADFREYLARILSIVRTNWRQVLPESARMGLLRGSTSVEFIINRDGSIPKLVTADESGSRALDTAAVAGLSMSNPLPPLPADFKGQQVRVAFTFSVSGKP
jgi:TonB family protein